MITASTSGVRVVLASIVAFCLAIAPRLADAATLTPAATAAWNARVATTEARIGRELSSWRRSLVVEDPR